MNILLKTDNLVGLEYLIKQKGLAGKIDLIYTAPPLLPMEILRLPMGEQLR